LQVQAAMSNNGLEAIQIKISDVNEAQRLQCILRLNKEGRRYLIEEPTSVERGVDVLSRVRHDLD
jgi:hypothetical protein